jgi:hypothetical protein
MALALIMLPRDRTWRRRWWLLVAAVVVGGEFGTRRLGDKLVHVLGGVFSL